MKRRLIVSDGQHERELLLVGTIVVGRDPACDVSEDGDSLLSRRHTEFVAGPDGVVVRDLGSRNGTFVNGVKIAEGAIHPGDVVHIGHLRLRFVEDDAPLASGPAAAPVRHVAPIAVVDDEEVTRIIQTRPEPVVQAASGPPVSADDERTVVTPRPGSTPASVPARAAATSPVNADDERTVFVALGASGRTPVPAVSQQKPPAPPTQVVEPRPRALGAIKTFVSVQVAAVATIVFVALVMAFVLGRSELLSDAASGATLLKWIGLPAAIALLAAYNAGRLINRRIARILMADKEEGRGL